MASQRHKVWEQGSSAAGEIHAQGVVAPGIAMQVNPSDLNSTIPGDPLLNAGQELQAPVEPQAGGLVVPVGAEGGPLQGSSLTGAIPEGAPVPPEPGTPVLSTISPSTAAFSAPPFTMILTGSGFNDTTTVLWGGVALAGATLTGAQSMTVPIDPPNMTYDGTNNTAEVRAANGGQWSNPKTFKFTGTPAVGNEEIEGGGEPEPEPEPQPEPQPEPEPEGRTFPIGPLAATIVEDHADGIAITVEDASQVQEGDTVLVEATGNTPMNGSYTVMSLDGNTMVVDNMVELASPIENRGRVTVTAGRA